MAKLVFDERGFRPQNALQMSYFLGQEAIFPAKCPKARKVAYTEYTGTICEMDLVETIYKTATIPLDTFWYVMREWTKFENCWSMALLSMVEGNEDDYNDVEINHRGIYIK